MAVHVRQKGHYELFETTRGHRILVLDGRRWYAWVKGQAGELLVRSDSDHQKRRTVSAGAYLHVEFEDDPQYKDMPHLFLQDGARYQELVLPEGLPNDRDYQKKLIAAGKPVPRRKLDDYVSHPQPSGPGEKRMSRPKGGSMANVAHYLKGTDFPADRNALLRHAREKSAPREVLHQLKLLQDSRYRSMAEVTRAIGEGKQRSGEKLPIEHYDRLNVRDVRRRLDDLDLDHDELERLLDHERHHKNRKTLRAAFERRL